MAFCSGTAGQKQVFPTYMLMPEHHCASQLLYPSQFQNLQRPQGSVLTLNAKVTDKNNHSVSFNPMPKCAHSLQGTLSNTPKPQMTRSTKAKRVLKDNIQKEATLITGCCTSYEGHMDLWKRNGLHSCHSISR